MASISPDESSEQLVIPTGNTNNRRRPRAESFDERKTRVKFAPGVTTTYFNAESPLPYNQNQYNEQQQQQLSSPNRPRSASCSSVGGNSTDSGNSSDGMGGNCETIVEEGVFVQQQKEQQAEQPIFDMD